ncbi:MAG: hypothetical protein ABIO57_02730 [Candidatus Paceibacterota bacterium]
MEQMNNIENFEEGNVVHLNSQEQANETQDTVELMLTLTARYDELQQKMNTLQDLESDGSSHKEEISDIQKEMNEIEEHRAQLESVTKDAA